MQLLFKDGIVPEIKGLSGIIIYYRRPLRIRFWVGKNFKEEISMRNLQKLTAGIIVLFMALAMQACDNVESATKLVSSDETADVVVVGAGLSGLSVATELQEAFPAVKFILLEQRDTVGGSSRSSGATMGSSSKDPSAFNTNTTAELLDFYKTYFGTDGVNEELFNKIYGAISVDTNNRLLDWGITFSQVAVYPEFTNFTPPIYSYRPTTPEGGNGGGAWSDFLAAKIREKSDIRINSRVTDLIIVNGKVIGVKVDDATKSYNIYAKAVILATGGFGSNRALVQEVADDFYKYIPIISYLDTFNPGATGDAFTFTKKLNVPLIGNDIFAFTMAQGSALPSKFFVNQRGERFTNEDSAWGYKTVHDAALQKTYTYRLIDANGLNPTQTTTQEARVTAGQAWKFNTIDELADGLGINKTALNTTVAAYNSNVNASTSPGFDLPYGKATKLETAPFYADLICGSDFGTVRSIKTDNFGRVLNASSQPIAGLYASGECIMANVFPGGYYHGGLGMSIASYTGTLAARTAAEDLAN
jgi:fumarate reductase flavoprotein subunit